MKKRSTVFAAALMFLGAQAQCQTAYMYIDNGGGDVHQTYSMLSVVDTTAGKQLADLKIEGETLEAMALEKEKLIPPALLKPESPKDCQKRVCCRTANCGQPGQEY